MVGASVSSNAVSGRSIFGRTETAATAIRAKREAARSRADIRKRYARAERLSTKKAEAESPSCLSVVYDAIGKLDQVRAYEQQRVGLDLPWNICLGSRYDDEEVCRLEVGLLPLGWWVKLESRDEVPGN
jgi:hypothetical protein